ncbi:Hypothetical_protein [Hexamita inflata]|uniref:Hypothetical_protein n=1 Tax=Hexamita inflata TaxID=28002 RepID=A0AA86P7Y8_9EUKA|nr:Hypothetical protein HINF_LOCUS21013 [Hexamita inflata]
MTKIDQTHHSFSFQQALKLRIEAKIYTNNNSQKVGIHTNKALFCRKTHYSCRFCRIIETVYRRVQQKFLKQQDLYPRYSDSISLILMALVLQLLFLIVGNQAQAQ